MEIPNFSRLAPSGFGISSFKIGQLIYVILVCVRTYLWNLFWNLPLVLDLKSTKKFPTLDTNAKTINIAWNLEKSWKYGKYCESFQFWSSTSVKTNICITTSTIVHPSYDTLVITPPPKHPFRVFVIFWDFFFEKISSAWDCSHFHCIIFLEIKVEPVHIIPKKVIKMKLWRPFLIKKARLLMILMTVMNRKSNFRAKIHYFSDQNANIVDFWTSKTVIFSSKILILSSFHV